MPAPTPSAVLNSKIASMLSIPRRRTWRGARRPARQMKSVRAGALLFRGEARGDRSGPATGVRCQVKARTSRQWLSWMEQGGDLRRVPRLQRRLEGREPVLRPSRACAAR